MLDYVRSCSDYCTVCLSATLVMTVTATDADKAGTINSQISYTIVEQGPLGSPDMFYMNKATGEIFVKLSTLDREVSHLKSNMKTGLLA